jgi:hypothetical protein
MSNLPAKHYLGIYRTRQKAIRKGVTHPAEKVIQFVDQLVSELEVLDPDEKIEITANETDSVFRVEKTGKILAEMHN